jgi:O-antigen/teichoic acid export membrane protein
MKRTLLRNFSLNSAQLIINQGFNLIIFYILSTSFNKSEFGLFNWSLAILLTSFTILSFGLDQVSIRKIASGNNPNEIRTLYFRHVLIFGIIFLGILSLVLVIYPTNYSQKIVLAGLGLGKLMLFLSTPFKQIAVGLESFSKLFYMSICSTVLKGMGLLILYLAYHISLINVILLYVTAESFELIICIIISSKLTGSYPHVPFSIKKYKDLIREALPQGGTVLFSSILARLDWILIGLFYSYTKVAEYSFSYKIFEISTLPLLAIAPLLVPLFTRTLKDNSSISDQKTLWLLKAEIAIGCFIALLLNILWTPVIDYITSGKYGASNSAAIFILSLCMPLLYFNNMLWSIHFSQNRLKMIFYVFSLTFIINLGFDLILIPLWGNQGAAAGYLIAIFIQTYLYSSKLKQIPLSSCWLFLAGHLSSGIISGLIAHLFSNHYFSVIMAVIIYGLLMSVLYPSYFLYPIKIKRVMNWQGGNL